MQFYEVEKSYIDYLRQFDKNVLIEKQTTSRKYIGVLFEIGSLKYVAPLSSPKAKYEHMRNQYDVFLLKNGELGVINFNLMIPVKQSVIRAVDFSKVADKQYRRLLQKQYVEVKKNREVIMEKAQKMYQLSKKTKLSDYERKVLKRTVNFEKLEVMQKYH